MGPGTGTVRVGLAREPEGEDIAAATATKSRHQENANILASILSDVNKIMSEKQAINQDQRQVLSLERKLIMQRLGYTPPDEGNKIILQVTKTNHLCFLRSCSYTVFFIHATRTRI